jgi:hypothetical protein
MLAGRLSSTAPFGWTRSQATLKEYIADTCRRLGGHGLPDDDHGDLVTFLQELPNPPRARPAHVDLVATGQAVFRARGCAQCHVPGPGTDGQRHKLDGEDKDAVDTPSLRRVGSTGPYFHDGRYPTLDDLLGDRDSRMGATALLSRPERQALRAFPGVAVKAPLAAALALALGCAASPGVMSQSMPEKKDRLSSHAAASAQVLRVSPFDYTALPALESVRVTGDLESSTIAFQPGQNGVLEMTGSLVAEIEVGSYLGPVAGFDLEAYPGVSGRESGAYYHVFRELDERGPSLLTPARGAESLCGPAAVPGLARWQGYLHDSRTEDRLVFVCYEGKFEPRTCRANAERAFRVVARPVAGGAAFAFRARDGECSAPTLIHEERLAIVGPRPLWLSSTAPLALRRTEGGRSFARVLVPVGRPLSSSVVIDVRPSDARLFGSNLGRLRDPMVFSISVEVVWARSDPAPTATAFVAAISAHDTSELNASALSEILR